MIAAGKRFWGVDIEFLQENRKKTTSIASYEPFHDRIEFHLRCINKLSKEFPDFIHKEMEFDIFHELGHGKEARIYEENGLFPYAFPILSKRPMPADVRSEINKIIKNMQSSIDDYKVDKKLFKNNILISSSTWFSQAITNMEKILEKPGYEMRDRQTALMNLPLTLCSFKFSKLSNEQKRVIRSYYQKFLGKRKWKEALKNFEILEFGQINTTVDTFIELINEFFNWTVSLNNISKKELETIIMKKQGITVDYKLPNFWKKDNYSHYSIQVPPTRLL